MNELTIKEFTTARYQNMRKCDQSYYKFSADWSQPQTKSVCQKALAEVARKLALIGNQGAWGSKPDTPELLTQLVFLIGGLKLGDDAQQNSFACYQVERYFFRVWYRGTKEERDALCPKTSAPVKAKAEPKQAPKKKPAPKKAKKPVAVKSVVSTDDKVEPEVIEIDAPTPVVGQVMDALVQLLVTELTNEQKQKFVSALTIALQQSI